MDSYKDKDCMYQAKSMYASNVKEQLKAFEGMYPGNRGTQSKGISNSKAAKSDKQAGV